MTRQLAVVAALIEREGKMLGHRRPAGKVRGGLWELPGGKVEPGESETAALSRECEEELGVAVRVGRLVWRGVHAYEDLHVALAVYRVVIVGDAPLVAHEGGRLAWVAPADIPQLGWSAADRPIVEAWSRGRL